MNTKLKLKALIPGAILSAGLLLPVPRAGGDTLYVDANSRTPAAPYDSWQNAAVRIQDAIDAASAGDEIVVTNGVYGTGGRVLFGKTTNRVAVVGPFTVRSVNGPQFTVIKGRQVPGSTNGVSAIRGVYLTDGAVLSGFTVTNGATAIGEPGGGIYCDSTAGLVTNCNIISNSADDIGGGVESGTLEQCTLSANTAASGGGASDSILTNCVLTNNLATEGGGAYSAVLNHCTLRSNAAGAGGGVSSSTLNQCTLSGNSAAAGGGAYYSTLNNSILSGNSADNAGGGACGSVLTNCTLAGNSSAGYGGGTVAGTLNNCIIYYNTGGVGGNDFVEGSDLLNYCCAVQQPTNGFGNITDEPLFVDLAGGNLRLQSNSPCMNAGNNAYAPAGPDLDGNPRIVGGTVDIGAYEFQTISALRLVSATPVGTNVTVSWQSVAGVTYFLEWRTNLSSSSSYMLLATNLTGKPDLTSFTHTNAAVAPRIFYRVGVGTP